MDGRAVEAAEDLVGDRA
ncbi:UNVERIFIED_CONTAM: hypothetical protein GTU68_007176 [Idotea baltica]|nr:hypothetical protein [Idotea baltica]